MHLVASSVVFSYKGHLSEPIKVGAELGVDAVLSSRILLSHDLVVIRTELINVASGWRLWGEQYTRPFSDILTMENELSTCISEKLLSSLTEQEKKHLIRAERRSVEHT